MNALYFILLGSVKVYDNTPESLNFMRKTLLIQDKHAKENDEAQSPVSISSRKSIDSEDLNCLDDRILWEFKNDILKEKDKGMLFKTVKELQYGENFGCKFYDCFEKLGYI